MRSSVFLSFFPSSTRKGWPYQDPFVRGLDKVPSATEFLELLVGQGELLDLFVGLLQFLLKLLVQFLDVHWQPKRGVK